MRQRILRTTTGAGPAALLILAIALMSMSSAARAQGKIDWRSLEKRLPARVVVGPETEEFGYSFETQRYAVTVPEPFLTGGAEAKRALKNALAESRIDSVVGLVLLTRLGDRPAAKKLSAMLTDRHKLQKMGRRSAAALPMVLRYHTPDNEWPPLFINALQYSPSPVDTTIIACLTKYDLPEAEDAYMSFFPRFDAASQQRIVDRMTVQNKTDSLLWKFLTLSRISQIQNMLLDRLEQMKSPLWPAHADSLAYIAVGDAACRVLGHASPTDTSVYRPLMRRIIDDAEMKDCILQAALQLSAEGDMGALPGLKYRFHESDLDIRVVTALAICRLGDTKGIGASIRLGLKHEKYRKEVIKALESVTGLAYGGDQEKWEEWFANYRRY